MSVRFSDLKIGDRVTIDTAPLIASREATGNGRAGVIMDLNPSTERVWFAPDGSTPLWVYASWILSKETA